MKVKQQTLQKPTTIETPIYYVQIYILYIFTYLHSSNSNTHVLNQSRKIKLLTLVPRQRRQKLVGVFLECKIMYVFILS